MHLYFCKTFFFDDQDDHFDGDYYDDDYDHGGLFDDNDEDVWYLICEDMIKKCNSLFTKRCVARVDFDF